MYTLWSLGDTLTALTVTSSPTTMDVLVAAQLATGRNGRWCGCGRLRTVIVMLSSSLPVMLPARSSTVPLPPWQPYTVSVASDGGSTNRVPEHWLLLPRTAVESVAKPSHGDSPGGSHSAVTVVDPPTSIVVTEAVSQPRADGVGVGVAVGLGLGVFVAVGLGVFVAVGLGVFVAVGLGVFGPWAWACLWPWAWACL